MTTFRRILVATDFSAASSPAFDLALRIASLGKATLLVAHVWKEPHLADLSLAHTKLYVAYEQSVRAKAARELEGIVERARKLGIDAHSLLLDGFADDAIVESARARHADLIVMGTHGRRGPGRFFLGSVAARVVAMAPCPVVTVRADGTTAAGKGEP